jgi:L-ascorbate metabolism protein UlaG (beta-lactamase superfamily)
MMKKCLFLGLVSLFAVSIGLGPAESAEQKPLKIRWFGQSCFLITWPNGTSILIDPFNPKVGYDMPSPRPDAVLVSHEHFDHNYIEMARGNPQVIRGLTGGGDWNKVSTLVKGITVKTVGTYHDDKLGMLRGKNTVFVMEGQGYRIAHLGDLGHQLGVALIKEIGSVDVLMIPVGGTYTIDAEGADKVVEKLKPKVILPMHYKTDRITIPIAPVEPFLAGKLGVKRIKGNLLELDKIPETPVVFVLDYK